MNRKPTSIPLKTWQFFSACIAYLEMPTMNKIYCGLKSKRCPRCDKELTESRERQIQRWSSDPDTTASHQRNPIDRYEILLKKMMALGEADIARACVRRQALVVGCDLVVKDYADLNPDKRTIAEECLDDLGKVAAYHEALMDPDSDSQMIQEAKAAAMRELDENEVLFLRKRGEQ